MHSSLDENKTLYFKKKNLSINQQTHHCLKERSLVKMSQTEFKGLQFCKFSTQKNIFKQNSPNDFYCKINIYFSGLFDILASRLQSVCITKHFIASSQAETVLTSAYLHCRGVKKWG